MKKLIALCVVFVFSTAFYAQTVVDKAKAKTEKTAKKVEKKVKTTTKKVGDKTEKTAKKVEVKTKATAKKVGDKAEKTAVKVETKTKTTADKVKTKTKTTAKKVADKTEKTATKVETKTKETASRIKKDGTPDKRFKKTPAEEKEDMKDTPASRVAEKKVKDKVTGSYKGKKIFTGPRGGRYYINKNGNKTYISDDK